MIKVVGMGPGNIQYMTMEAIDVIKAAEEVIAFGRIAETAHKIVDKVIEVHKVDEIIHNLVRDRSTAILASGDPCFFGIVNYLERAGVIIDEVIPGISSIQYMMAKLKKSWHNAELLSLHGRDEDINKVLKSKLSIILTDSRNTPDSISKRFSAHGMLGKIYTGYNLSYEDENILVNNIGEEIEPLGNISVVVIENEMA
jgi:cobalt-precorrin-7 (C5)-methyltransferase